MMNSGKTGEQWQAGSKFRNLQNSQVAKFRNHAKFRTSQPCEISQVAKIRNL